jgi:hypothetical protein
MYLRAPIKQAISFVRVVQAVLILWVAVTVSAASGSAQISTPFDTIGLIQDATIDQPGVTLSAAWITVDHHDIRVPANLIVQNGHG